MRALILISSLMTSGAERVTVSFLLHPAVRQLGAIACTFTAREDGPLAAELVEAGVARYDLGALRRGDPLPLPRLMRLIRRERIDVVHAHGPEAAILGAAARYLSRVPLIITRHVLDDPWASWRAKMHANLAVCSTRRADAVVAVSVAAADRLAELAGLSRAAIRVIHNGIDLAKFARPNLAARRVQLRHALGFADDDAVVLVPSVLRQGKGHEVLIAALPSLKARLPGTRLAFAGSGEREAELRALARPYGDAILFLGARTDTPELLAACDLAALPSYAEALPTALIEAAAAGRPVVATHVGGSPEVVEDGRTGLLVPPEDAAALADAIASLLSDPPRARAFGEAARLRAEEYFSLDLQVERTLALWSEVVERARP